MSEQITVATTTHQPKVVIDPPVKADAPQGSPGEGGPHTPVAAGSTPAPATSPEGEPKPADGADVEDKNLGRAFARLAKKDKALQVREAQIKTEGEQLRAVRDALATAKSKKDLIPLLELAGVDPAELTDILVSYGKEPSEAERIDALERQREADDKKRRDDESAATERAEAAHLQATVAAFKGKLTDAAKAGGDKYELTLLKGDDGIDLAFEVVNAHYEKTVVKDAQGRVIRPGQVLPFDEALALAEGHYETEAKRFAGSKKFGAKPQPSSEQGGASSTQHAPAETLTNNHASGAPPTEPRRNLTRAQSIAASVEFLKSKGW